MVEVKPQRLGEPLLSQTQLPQGKGEARCTTRRVDKSSHRIGGSTHKSNMDWSVRDPSLGHSTQSPLLRVGGGMLQSTCLSIPLGASFPSKATSKPLEQTLGDKTVVNLAPLPFLKFTRFLQQVQCERRPIHW